VKQSVGAEREVVGEEDVLDSQVGRKRENEQSGRGESAVGHRVIAKRTRAGGGNPPCVSTTRAVFEEGGSEEKLREGDLARSAQPIWGRAGAGRGKKRGTSLLSGKKVKAKDLPKAGKERTKERHDLFQRLRETEKKERDFRAGDLEKESRETLYLRRGGGTRDLREGGSPWDTGIDWHPPHEWSQRYEREMESPPGGKKQGNRPKNGKEIFGRDGFDERYRVSEKLT